MLVLVLLCLLLFLLLLKCASNFILTQFSSKSFKFYAFPAIIHPTIALSRRREHGTLNCCLCCSCFCFNIWLRAFPVPPRSSRNENELRTVKYPSHWTLLRGQSEARMVKNKGGGFCTGQWHIPYCLWQRGYIWYSCWFELGCSSHFQTWTEFKKLYDSGWSGCNV